MTVLPLVRGRLRAHPRARLINLATLLVALALAEKASADDLREECIAGYEEGQRLSLDGKLRASRAQLLQCARAGCPKITQEDCTKWLTALEPKVPTVLISAKDASGRDIERLRVVVDGEVLVERLDGRPIEVDPGGHTFRYESGEQVVQERVVLIEGEKNRRLQVVFPALAKPAVATTTPAVKPPVENPGASDGRRTIPTISWILGTVSLVGLTSFIGFGATGKSAEGCAPTCTRGEVDEFRRDFLIADLSLLVALVAGGAAVYFALQPQTQTSATTPTAR